MADPTEKDETRPRRRGSYGLIPPEMSEQLPPLNLVLFGATGAGKSTFIKSIFRGAELSAVSSPGQCVKHQGEVCGRWVSLVELPALSGKPLETVMQQCLSCISLCGPEGVHAFILVLPVAPLTDEDKAEIEMIQDSFSSRVRDFTVALLTVESDSVAVEEDVQELCQSFRGGSLMFNTRGQQQVSKLLDSVETLMAKNKAHSYTTETLTQHHIEKISALHKELQIQQSMNRKYDLEKSDTRRIVLLGKTGSGKSSLANTLFEKQVFKSALSALSVTNFCQKAEGEVEGRSVSVVDTPGLFDTALSEAEFVKEILKGVSLVSPGPHVFLLVLRIGRITREETEILKHMDRWFGREAHRFTMVVFTHGDDLEHDGVSPQRFISFNPSLKKLISDCGDRYHVVNNREIKDRAQVKELMKKMEDLVRANGGDCYTNDTIREAEVEVKQKESPETKLKELQVRYQQEKSQNKQLKEELSTFRESMKKDVEGLIHLQQQFEKKEEMMMRNYREMKSQLEKIRAQTERRNDTESE